MTIFAVYYLRDPNTQDVRYVGCTRDPARRLRQHCAFHGYNDALNAWIDGLWPSIPIMQVLCWLGDPEEAERIETALTDKLRRTVFNIFIGTRRTEATRARIRATWTEERRKLYSLRALEANRSRHYVGVPQSENTCDEKSKSLASYHKGRSLPERLARGAAISKGRRSRDC